MSSSKLLIRLREGDPSIFLPMIHFVLLMYSKKFAQLINSKGYDLFAKSDYRFMENTFHMLRQHFNYKPLINLNQFLAMGYAERKILLILDIITILKENIKMESESKPCEQSIKTSQNLATDQYLPKYTVVNHMTEEAHMQIIKDEEKKLETPEKIQVPVPTILLEKTKSSTKEKSNSPKESSPSRKLNSPNRDNGNTQILNVISQMNQTMSELSRKIDIISDTLGVRVDKIETQLLLLGNKLSIVEQVKKQESNAVPPPTLHKEEKLIALLSKPNEGKHIEANEDAQQNTKALTCNETDEFITNLAGKYKQTQELLKSLGIN